MNSWTKDEITKYSSSLLKLLKEQAVILNTDDTDMIQYSLGAIRDSIEADSSLVTVVLPDTASVTSMMEILLSILKVHKKMVNLIQFFVDILGIYFDGAQRLVTPEQRSLFKQIIGTGYSENKENGDVMKELIRVAPRFCSE